MNIIHPDIDGCIVDVCELDTLRCLSCVNRWFNNRVFTDSLYGQYLNGRGKSFREICGMGFLDYAKIIIKPEDNIYNAFDSSCIKGQLDVAKWLFSLKNFGHYYFCIINDILFPSSCLNGHIDIAKWLVSLGENGYGKIDIHNWNNQAFYDCVYCGHLNILKWLVELGENGYGKFDIHASNERAFETSCQMGHLDIAQWLVYLGENGYGKIDIKPGWEIALYSEYGGQLDIAKWLVSLADNGYCKFDIHEDDDRIFNDYLKEGRIDILKWLIELGENGYERYYTNKYRQLEKLLIQSS